MRKTPLFSRVAVIGLGLVGGSLALAMRRARLAGHIAGHAKSADTRKRAGHLVDSMHRSAAAAAEGADLIILCTPPGAFERIVKTLAPVLTKGQILTDVGSVKGYPARIIPPLLPEGVLFIPGHPVAGTEESGPDAGFAELFDAHFCILTPLPRTPRAALHKLRRFWTECGARVSTMTPDTHDRVLAMTSHLPHAVAYALVGTALNPATAPRRQVVAYSAGGFRDFTRIAASDPVMWRDIFIQNQDALLETLTQFEVELKALRADISAGNTAALEKRMRRTRTMRRGIIKAGQETPDADFGRRKPSQTR